MSQDVSVFDDYNLSSVKIFLNSEFYPCNDLNVDFGKKRYAVLFDVYVHFRNILRNRLFRNATQHTLIYRESTFCDH